MKVLQKQHDKLGVLQNLYQLLQIINLYTQNQFLVFNEVIQNWTKCPNIKILVKMQKLLKLSV